MLNVHKKSGHVEEFTLDKIKTSIENSSDAANIKLNKKDIDLIGQDVENLLVGIRGKDGLTSSYEIRAVATKVLRDWGFEKVAYSFYTGK